MRCAYEFQRFEKVAWSHVQKGAKLVFEVRLMNHMGPVCICLLWNPSGSHAPHVCADFLKSGAVVVVASKRL